MLKKCSVLIQYKAVFVFFFSCILLYTVTITEYCTLTGRHQENKTN